MNSFFDRVRRSGFGTADPFLETAAGRILSYADMLEHSGRMANALLASGVAPGDRVAAQVEKSPEAIMLYLACLRAGAAFLPLNSAYTLAEMDYFIADAAPKLTVCAPEKATTIAALAQRHGGLTHTLDADGSGTLTERATAADSAFDDRPAAADDLAAIVYTSGTTGRSKGAMITHGNLLSNAEALVEIWRFGRNDVLLHALPVFHVHGLFVAINTVLFSGSSMIFLPRFDAGEVLQLMPRASVLMGVPTFYTRLLQHPGLTRETASRMRLFVSGSAPLLEETHRAFTARTGHAILERYGMTETGMNTSNPYDGERRPGAVGFALPRVEARVVDPVGGAVLPQEETGMIEVKGPNVFSGYWQQPEKTRAEFKPDGFFITGDLGKFDRDGYLHIVGRGKDLIITGGYNVYPKEVEAEIDALPGVLESAVIGLPHADFGEAVTAIVVPESDGAVAESDILGLLENRLAAFKRPKRVLLLAQLPRNTMGKVQKAELRRTYSSLYAPATENRR